MKSLESDQKFLESLKRRIKHKAFILFRIFGLPRRFATCVAQLLPIAHILAQPMKLLKTMFMFVTHSNVIYNKVSIDRFKLYTEIKL